MGQQIREARARFPTGGGAGQSAVESHIKDKCFSWRKGERPEIPNRIPPKERLAEVPEFACQSKFARNRVRDRNRLPKLPSAHAPLLQLSEK